MSLEVPGQSAEELAALSVAEVVAQAAKSIGREDVAGTVTETLERELSQKHISPPA